MRITVKLGGSILEEASIRGAILSQVAEAASLGHEVILVHGGGKSLNRRLSQMGIESRFAEGLRVTDSETLSAAVMVLAGEVNKKIVSEMNRSGARAVGICGADAGAVRCIRLSDLPDNPAGIGFVGKPSGVNRSFFDRAFDAGWIPVVSSIALGPDGQLYNVNADQMASACASGTGCSSLVYLTDVAGVKDEKGSVLRDLKESDIAALRRSGIVKGGMLPKTSSCLEALAAGVRDALILPGSRPGILMQFIDGTLTEGTHIHGNR
ncbi:MAG: acetylglutamate kinase [Acidobacteria bacterium]|nr:acetylglutamate kinase [Acidobacteriota bacterium]